MNKKWPIVILLFLFQTAKAQTWHITVFDSLSKRAVVGATAKFNNFEQKTTDFNGNLSVSAKSVRKSFFVEKSGYENTKIEVTQLLSCTDSQKPCVFFLTPIDRESIQSGQKSVAEWYVAAVDSISKKPVEGVFAKLNNYEQAVADINGLLVIPTKSVRKSFLLERKGYETLKIDLQKLKNCTDLQRPCQFLMSPFLMDEVVVKPIQVFGGEMGRVVIPISRILALPQVGGEKDIIKALQFVPGVVSGNEAQSSFMVRGGGNEQNLIMLDGIPIYNQGHYLNLLSIFNPTTVSNVELFKSGFPSAYGGRLSSVLNINQKDGFGENIREVSVGILTSKLTFSQSFFNDNFAVIASVRNSNLGVFTFPSWRKYRNPLEQSANTNVINVNDLSLKATYRNKKSKLSLGYYKSYDYFFYGDRSRNVHEFNTRRFINDLYSLNYFNQVNQKTTLVFNAGFTSSVLDEKSSNVAFRRNPNETKIFNGRDTVVLSNATFTPIDTLAKKYRAGIGEFSINSNLNHQFSKNLKFSTGFNLYSRKFNPFSFQEFSGIEGAIFANTEINRNKFSMNVGLRVSGFQNEDFLDINLEPRILLSYVLSNKWKAYTSYDRMTQYSHALTHGVDFFDRMVWIPASEALKPEKGHQFSLGISMNDKKLEQTLSADVFYKTLSNQVFYTGGADVQFNVEQVAGNTYGQGQGVAYGFELAASKTFEKLSAQVAYTFSETDRRFDDLNGGEPFQFIFNRKHNFNTNMSWNINKKWNVSGLFVLMSGRPINFPASQVLENIYTPRLELSQGFYNINLPPTHRLDLAANYTVRKTKRKEVIWGFSVYNAYNRKNPYAAKIQYNESQKENGLQTSYLTYKHLLPIIPSVTYTLKW